MPRRPDLPLPDVFTRDVARRHGFSRGQVETRIANGEWRTLRRGAFCTETRWQSADARSRAVLRVAAASLVVGGDTWISHASAAALLGLPMPLRDDRAWLTRLPPGTTVNTDGLTVEVATLPLVDQRVRDDMALTSPRRTVADCLRHCHPADGLAIADAAEREWPGLLESVGLVLANSERWPYVARALRLAPLVDGRRESPLESWSAWAMDVAGLPEPVPQVDLYDRHGTFLGRGDFWWDGPGVLGEADGRTKYGFTLNGTAEEVAAALEREKRREDDIRRAGAHVVRWGARDLGRPRTWARLLKEALSQRRTFTGTAVPTSRPRAGHPAQAFGA